jgi:hypothetical protein
MGQQQPGIGEDVTHLMPDVGEDVTALMGNAPPAQPTGVRQTIANGIEQGVKNSQPFGIPWDVAVGVTQGAGKTAIGLGQLLASGARMIPGADRILPSDDQFNGLRDKLAAQNTQQTIGQGAEKVAEFMAPAGLISKAKLATTTGRVALDALIGAGLEGAGAGAVGAAQSGSLKEGAKTGAIAGATAAVVPAALSAASAGTKMLAERVERSLIKPTKADILDGFNASNIFKYKLGGSLTDTYEKTQKAIEQYSSDLQKYTNISTQLGRKVNLLDELSSVSADLSKDAARNFGQNNAINGAVQKLLDDPLWKQIAPNGDVDLATATKIKQAVGEMGAWLHDPSGRVIGDDNKAMETVANALYAKLKNAITDNAVGPIKAINKSLSDLIPIRQAIIRRIPVEQRANVLNLGDLLGFSSGHLGLSLANRILKSGQFANLANAGAEVVGQNAAPLASAATSGIAAGVTPR